MSLIPRRECRARRAHQVPEMDGRALSEIGVYGGLITAGFGFLANNATVTHDGLLVSAVAFAAALLYRAKAVASASIAGTQAHVGRFGSPDYLASLAAAPAPVRDEVFRDAELVFGLVGGTQAKEIGAAELERQLTERLGVGVAVLDVAVAGSTMEDLSRQEQQLATAMLDPRLRGRRLNGVVVAAGGENVLGDVPMDGGEFREVLTRLTYPYETAPGGEPAGRFMITPGGAHALLVLPGDFTDVAAPDDTESEVPDWLLELYHQRATGLQLDYLSAARAIPARSLERNVTLVKGAPVLRYTPQNHVHTDPHDLDVLRGRLVERIMKLDADGRWPRASSRVVIGRPRPRGDRVTRNISTRHRQPR